ncbi:hypothetical protein TruAng_006849 [Truncatella angustata]|nr:hypothetical protein TruAng_006849 [Truncatella angustata]
MPSLPNTQRLRLPLRTRPHNGIGFKTALALAHHSADFHILLGARTEDKGRAAVNELLSAQQSPVKASVSPIQIEITNQKSVNAARDHVEAQYGKLHVPVNNAGIVVYQDVDKYTAFRQSFETNVLGSMRMTETLEPLFRKSTKAYVIYVSSEQGSISLRLDPTHQFRKIQGESYRTSNAALNMVAARHRYNYADSSIQVFALNPGWCLSNLTGEQGRERSSVSLNA